MLNPRANPLFPVKGIWMPCVPTKVTFFAWEAAWGKVLTLDKLQRRGWHLPNHCYLCGQDEESIHHILLHCPMVSPFWDPLFLLNWLLLGLSKNCQGCSLQLEGLFCWTKEKKDLEICSTLHLLDCLERAQSHSF